MQKIYDDAKTNVDAGSRPFWIMARAVKDFIANEGQGMPPLSGALPDMVADTKSFVALQTLYAPSGLCLCVLIPCVQLQGQGAGGL
jgi:amyloid beta precursor protein binding protein 1